MCINLVDVNARMKLLAYLIPERRDILDELYQSTIFSAVDLKGAFHNIEISPKSRTFLGVIT